MTAPSYPQPPLPIRTNPKQVYYGPPPHARTLSNSNSRPSTASKGKGKGKFIANPDSGPESESDGDNYMGARTEHYLANGNVNGNSKGKAKMVDGFLDDGDEDLYD